MIVARERWGTTSDGDTVELVTLETGAIGARFASYGATLVALEIPDRRGERADVVLGFDTLAEYESPRNPHVGIPCHLHGGPRGFDRRVWTPTKVDGSTFGARLRSPDGEEGYPGALDVLAAYTLGPRDASLHLLGLQLLARAGAPTVVSLTQHGYFNLAGGGTILDHELEIPASRYVVVDDELVPTGEIASVEGTPLDFRTPCRIGERIDALLATPARGYDLCYLLDAPPLSAPAARLRDPASGRTLEIRTSQPGLQLYTGNRLDGLAGKRGRPIPRFGGVCLETQGLPDAIHHASFPSTVLRPGEPYAQTTIWAFSA